MPDLFLSIEVDDEEAEAYFDYAGYHARDLRRPLIRAMVEIVIPGIDEQFDTEGARSGGWRPVTDNWFRHKLKHATYLTTLMFDGDMRKEATSPTNIEVTRDGEADFVIDSDVARYHQSGMGNNPVRELIVWTPDDEEEFSDIWGDWLDDLRVANARRHGFADRPAPPSDIYVY